MKSKWVGISAGTLLGVLTIGTVATRVDSSGQKRTQPFRRATVESRPHLPKVEPSRVLELLLEAKAQDPAISDQELANRGNQLISKHGFNFSFSTCEIAEANSIRPSETTGRRSYQYDLSDLRGQKFPIELAADYVDSPCGCTFRFPILKLDQEKMIIVADGAPVELTRPKEFGIDEIELVGASLSRSVRRWFNHFDSPPIGISQDGRKVYFPTGYDRLRIKELAVEIGEEGVPRLVPLADPSIIKDGEEIRDFPPDPQNSYLGYKRFKGKTNSYILKFSYPCT